MLMGLLLQRILCQLVQKSDRFGWRSQLVAPKKNFAWLSFGQGVAEPHLVFDRVAHELDDATGHNRLPSSGKLVAQYSNVLGVTVDEFERRCRDPAYLASLTIDELRLVWQALSPYVMPRRYEHAGVGGGPLVRA